jgi:predicted dehydrogenase
MPHGSEVKWGVLGTASIATRKVIPAMKKGAWSEVAGIASRDLAKAQKAARELGIAKAYGSYEELLADPEIEAVYIPLPNHLHVPWTKRAAEAGKHVLCEKPMAMNAEEARTLLAVRERTKRKIGEAFMVKTQPQWLRTRELIRDGKIGELRGIVTVFSYYNREPQNVRQRPEWGGGGLMDIGCYPITLSRFMFGEEPVRVSGVVDLDPEFGVDRLASAVLEFRGGQSIFMCGMQTAYRQSMEFIGTKGRIAVEIPFNAPNDRPLRVIVDDCGDLFGGGMSVETIPACDQYTIQGDAFSRAIREDKEVAVPLEDAIANMEVIDAIFRSSKTGKWEKPGEGSRGEVAGR